MQKTIATAASNDAWWVATKEQRESLANCDAEILGALRREASYDKMKQRFVASTFDISYGSLPEEVAGPRHAFLVERLKFFVRIGLIKRASRIVNGQRVKGYIVPASLAKEEECTNGLTAADAAFLRSVGVSIEEHDREPVAR
jgi:hypothetical protein